ncbi:hypothetical protein BD777DRAFT_121049 [Yarrowia lipolytica]|nr:hypothetical protein BD777DRAFT_121049 [Yarrowia lipolytica]
MHSVIREMKKHSPLRSYLLAVVRSLPLIKLTRRSPLIVSQSHQGRSNRWKHTTTRNEQIFPSGALSWPQNSRPFPKA